MREPDFIIRLPFVPPSKNEWARLHWAEQRKIFRTWDDKVAECHRADKNEGNAWPAFKGKVTAQLAFYLPNRRKDEANIESFPPTWDILTQDKVTLTKRGPRHKRGLGIIEDDRPTILRKLGSEFVYQKGIEPHMEIRLWQGWEE